MHFRQLAVLLLTFVISEMPGLVFAQDARNVTEPVFPKTCRVEHAVLRSTSAGPEVAPDVYRQTEESAAETKLLKKDLKHCAESSKGTAVELALGDDISQNAFLIDPITIPPGVALIVDGGVTVFASRDPSKYQINKGSNPVTCGTYGADYPVQGGCSPLITLGAGSGIFGYGVIDGQGDKSLLAGPHANALTWWDLITQKPDGAKESSPLMISGYNTDSSNPITLYKITIRNPPWHTVSLGGENVTVWGTKVQAPWNIPNTDGFDLHASNATIYDTTVANGDQEIAISSGNAVTSHLTVNQFHGYSKGGIAILGDGDGTENPIRKVLIENSTITGDLPSFVKTTVNGQPEAFVNGLSQSEMLKKYGADGIQSYGQALPNATDLRGLQITANVNASDFAKNGAVIADVTFKSICIQDIRTPINIAPVVAYKQVTPGVTLPVVRDILFEDIHVLAPTSQFPNLVAGVPAPDGASGSYRLFLTAFPQAARPDFFNHLTLDNVVFDDSATGSSISSVDAEGNRVATNTNVYPLVSPFGVMAPGVFAVMTPPETSNWRVRTGIKVA